MVLVLEAGADGAAQQEVKLRLWAADKTVFGGSFTIDSCKYYTPTDGNFAVIDSWTKTEMFQMYAGSKGKLLLLFVGHHDFKGN